MSPPSHSRKNPSGRRSFKHPRDPKVTRITDTEVTLLDALEGTYQELREIGFRARLTTLDGRELRARHLYVILDLDELPFFSEDRSNQFVQDLELIRLVRWLRDRGFAFEEQPEEYRSPADFMVFLQASGLLEGPFLISRFDLEEPQLVPPGRPYALSWFSRKKHLTNLREIAAVLVENGNSMVHDFVHTQGDFHVCRMKDPIDFELLGWHTFPDKIILKPDNDGIIDAKEAAHIEGRNYSYRGRPYAIAPNWVYPPAIPRNSAMAAEQKKREKREKKMQERRPAERGA